MSIDPLLSSARKSLEAGKTSTAIESLVAAWRTVPAPELLELTCALEAPTPLQAAKGKDTAEALTKARKGKPDPRVSKALEQLLLDVPWTADSSKPVWRAAFELVTALKDPRWVALAKSLPAQWKFRAPMVAWMESQLKKAVAPLAPEVPSLSDAQKKTLSAMTPEKKASKPGNRDADALLAAVYAAPADDAPRRVYADFLLEQGDPRGEFIALQLAGDAASLKKADALQKKHDKDWLDGLTLAKDVRYQRGFLSSVKVVFKNQREAEKFGALPAWATIESLELDSMNVAIDQRAWSQTVPMTAVSLQHLRGFDGYGLEALVTKKQTLASLTTIKGHVGELEQWRVLTDPTRFPCLKEVTFSGVQPAWLAKAPPPSTWRVLRVRTDALGPMYRAVSTTKLEQFAWDFRGWASFEFSRGATGTLSKLVLRMTVGHAPKLVKEWLDQLPDGCLESFVLEGVADSISEAARQRLVRGSVAAVTGPERTRTAALAIFPGEDGRAWCVDSQGLIELDAKGGVLRDVAPGRWSSAAFSSDGARVFCGSADVVEVIATKTGERLAKNAVPCSTSYAHLSLSLDAKVLAAPMNPGVSVSWPSTKQKPAVYKGASCFTLTPDGKTLIRCDLTWGKGCLELHAVGEKTRGLKFAKDSPEFTAIACAPDGATFVTANASDVLQLWSIAHKTELRRVEDTKGVKRLAFSPDGRRVAAASSKRTWIVDVMTGTSTSLEGGATALAWTPDGTLLRG